MDQTAGDRKRFASRHVDNHVARELAAFPGFMDEGNPIRRETGGHRMIGMPLNILRPFKP
jgi:hypothetical protein